MIAGTISPQLKSLPEADVISSASPSTSYEYYLLLPSDYDPSRYRRRVLPLDPRSFVEPPLDGNTLYALNEAQFGAIEDLLRERNSTMAEDEQWVFAGLHVPREQPATLSVVIKLYQGGAPLSNLSNIGSHRKASGSERLVERLDGSGGTRSGAPMDSANIKTSPKAGVPLLRKPGGEFVDFGTRVVDRVATATARCPEEVTFPLIKSALLGIESTKRSIRNPGGVKACFLYVFMREFCGCSRWLMGRMPPLCIFELGQFFSEYS
ncbi:hypothetical protein RUND412_010980 [Rhizina undulata]